MWEYKFGILLYLEVLVSLSQWKTNIRDVGVHGKTILKWILEVQIVTL
jgi:hypothetical protein